MRQSPIRARWQPSPMPRIAMTARRCQSAYHALEIAARRCSAHAQRQSSPMPRVVMTAIRCLFVSAGYSARYIFQ